MFKMRRFRRITSYLIQHGHRGNLIHSLIGIVEPDAEGKEQPEGMVTDYQPGAGDLNTGHVGFTVSRFSHQVLSTNYNYFPFVQSAGAQDQQEGSDEVSYCLNIFPIRFSRT